MSSANETWSEKTAVLWMLIRIMVVYHSPRFHPTFSPDMTTTSSPLPSPRPKPDYKAYIPMSGAITTEPLNADLLSNDVTPTSPSQAHLLKRVLSQGSNGSTSASTSAALATPTSANISLSPSSGGVSTPKAKKAALLPEPGMTGGDGKTQQLVTDMDGLQVQSPAEDGRLPAGNLLHTLIGHSSQPQQSAHDRSFSSSTESSGTTCNPHPVPPSQLGSSYGPEGFSNASEGSYDGPSGINGIPVFNPSEVQVSAQAAAVVAAADEAIKQLNGTATVFRGPPTPGLPPPDNPFQLPRGYANFVKPQVRSETEMSPDHLVSRQSSTSSSTTEASTSSEESDLCIPSIEWVNLPNGLTSVGGHGLTQPPYVSSPTAAFQQQQQRGTPGRSPGRMAPPATTTRGVPSPRRTSAALAGVIGVQTPQPPSLPHQQSLPLGATAQTPGGLRQRAGTFPVGLPADIPTEEDDDDATVGHGRDRSSSTSSHSSQSGLDLLWQAAATHREPAAPSSPYEHPYDNKGKRKAGAEAVAQWRTSGIPVGKSGKPADQSIQAKDEQIMPPPPQKKRRRSGMQEDIDPALRDPEPVDSSAMDLDLGSDYQSGSASDEGEVASGDDSEYGGGKPRGRAAGRGRSGGKKGGRARVSTGTAPGVAGGSSSGKANGPKKGRKSGESPSGSGRGGGGGRRASAGTPGAGAGVQCEYVNPLPVSSVSRCIIQQELIWTIALQPMSRYLHAEIRPAPTYGTTCPTRGRVGLRGKTWRGQGVIMEDHQG